MMEEIILDIRLDNPVDKLDEAMEQMGFKYKGSLNMIILTLAISGMNALERNFMKKTMSYSIMLVLLNGMGI